MGSLRSEHLTGFLVPYPGIGDLEEPNTAAATTSSYNEADAVPGVAASSDVLSTLVPVVSGAQDGDLTVDVLRAGNPGVRKWSVQLGYRYTSEAATALRGWHPPNFVTGWECANYTTAGFSDYWGACVDPDDQRVLIAYGSVGGTVNFARFDPTTYAWTTLSSLTAASSSGCALLTLPTGRVLLVSYSLQVWRSDNFGTSWTAHGARAAGVNLDRMELAYSDGDILLVGLAPGTSDLSQYASTNGGAWFESVETVAGVGTKLSTASLPDGRIVVAYRRAADGRPCVRILGTPGSPFSEAAAIQVDTVDVQDLAIGADPDGSLVLVATRTANPQKMNVYRSPDGTDWAQFTVGGAQVSNGVADYLIPLKLVAFGGAFMCVHKFVASTDNHDSSPCGLILGGWSNVVADRVELTDGRAFGPATSGADGVLWIPIERPQDCGWTVTGTAGNGVLSAARLLVTSVASQCFYSYNLGTTLSAFVEVGVRMVSGGALATRDCGVTVSVADGASEYRIDLKFTTTQFRVTDPNSADKATITYDTTTEFDLLIAIDSTAGAVFYKRRTEAAWSTAWTGTLTVDGTPAANGLVAFGTIVASTNTCNWRLVGHSEGGKIAYSGGGTNAMAGKPIGADPSVLHPEVQVNGVVGRLAAIAGTGVRGESFAIALDHVRPARAIFPETSPSPSAKWRSADKTEQIRAFSLEENRALFGETPAILCVGCGTFRTAYLEWRNGAAWDTIVTLDLAEGFAGINYTLTAGTLAAAAGGVSPARYLQEGELAGGYAVLETGGGVGQVAIPIRWNTAGVWTTSGSTKAARVYLEGDGISTADATGQCDLVWPSGIAWNYQSSLIQQTRWRLRIPASQVTPYSYYEVGVLVPGAIRAPGAPHDWTRSREQRPNVRERRTRYGTSFVEEAGPPIRSLTIGWADGGADVSQLRTDALPDYVGVAGNIPLAAAEDVPWFLEGLHRFTKSGAIPVAAILRLPGADGTLTDPTSWLYGRISTPIGTDMERGKEGVDEWERPMALTIDEIV